MEFLKKVHSGICSNAVAVSGSVLGVGLLGLFCFKRRCIPDYMGAISYFVTCVGIYTTTVSLLRRKRRNVGDKIPKDNSQPREVLDALESAIAKRVAEQIAEKEVKQKEVKELQKGWEEQSQNIAEYLARCRKEAELQKTTTCGLDETELTCFNSLRKRADLPEPAESGIAEYLKNAFPKLPETQDETVAAAESPLTVNYYSSVKEELPCKLQHDPELIRKQYEIEMNNLLRLVSEGDQPSSATADPQQELDGNRDDESDLAKQKNV